MNKYPSITGLKLEQCCIDSINEMNELINSGKLIQIFSVVGSLGMLLASPPKDPGYSTLLNITFSDWELYAKAIKAVPNIIKQNPKTIAAKECLNRHIGRPLHKFWYSMYNSVTIN